MQQYIRRFNKDDEEEVKKAEDDIEVRDEEGAGQTEFVNTYDYVKGRT
jgi:hypothetical protein